MYNSSSKPLIISDNDPYDVWVKLISELYSRRELLTDAGDRMIYPALIVSTIYKPTTKCHPNEMYSQQFIDQYASQILSGDKKGFEYTYGERLNAYQATPANITVNQIDKMIERLKKDKFSRRACSVTWNPYVDPDLDDCPCMQWVKLYIDRGLNMQVLFRSHDLVKGYYANVLMLSNLLIHAAYKLNVPIGNLEIVSSQGHYYNVDENLIRVILDA